MNSFLNFWTDQRDLDDFRRISRATTTSVGAQDDNDRNIIENIYDTTPQFSHKIVVAIDFGTTYRYYLIFGVKSFYLGHFKVPIRVVTAYYIIESFQ